MEGNEGSIKITDSQSVNDPSQTQTPVCAPYCYCALYMVIKTMASIFVVMLIHLVIKYLKK